MRLLGKIGKLASSAGRAASKGVRLAKQGYATANKYAPGLTKAATSVARKVANQQAAKYMPAAARKATQMIGKNNMKMLGGVGREAARTAVKYGRRFVARA